MFNEVKLEVEIGWFDPRNCKLAKLHEFGSSNLPQRSHLYEVYVSSDFQNYIDTDYVRGRLSKSPRDGMEAIGRLFVNFYQTYVLAGRIKPKLKPATIIKKAKKGAHYPSIPLVDTQNMLKSITYRVG